MSSKLKDLGNSLCRTNVLARDIAGDLIIHWAYNYSSIVRTLIDILVNILDGLNYYTDLNIHVAAVLLEEKWVV
jgi:hypothetical protein